MQHINVLYNQNYEHCRTIPWLIVFLPFFYNLSFFVYVFLHFSSTFFDYREISSTCLYEIYRQMFDSNKYTYQVFCILEISEENEIVHEFYFLFQKLLEERMKFELIWVRNLLILELVNSFKQQISHSYIIIITKCT